MIKHKLTEGKWSFLFHLRCLLQFYYPRWLWRAVLSLECPSLMPNMGWDPSIPDPDKLKSLLWGQKNVSEIILIIDACIYIIFKKMVTTVFSEHAKLLQQMVYNNCLVLLLIKEPSAVNWTDKWEALIWQRTRESQCMRSSHEATKRMFPWLQRDILKCFSGERPSGVRCEDSEAKLLEQ